MLRSLGKLILKAGGWTAVGGIPDDPKAVIIAAPHTSNWDGLLALAYKVVIGLDVRFFAKHSVFWFPLGNLLRFLGGIELDRKRAGPAVDQAIAMFEEKDTFYFGLAPEGTRKLTSGWKTGFYRIALGAGVPVYMGFIDFGNKRIGIGPKVELSGDPEADLEIFRDFYDGIEGRWPEKSSPIELTSKPEKKRSIRSFVRRAGRITPSQQRALDELWPTYGIDCGTDPLNFESLFPRPVVLEVGFGNGETLVEQAAANPDKNFIGIEVHEPGVGHCLLKTEEAGIRNLRVIAHDAIEILAKQVPPRSLSRINLYFPDPWPKKRHHKRRIVQPAFLDLVAGRLADGGTLNIATDWADYAEHIDDVFSRSNRFTCTERREHDGDRPLDRPQTKFERRGLKKGHSIVDWCFRRQRASEVNTD